MFGTTGWRRRFRISIDGSNLRSEGPEGALAARRKNAQGKAPKWYFKTQALGGSLQVRLIPVGDEDVTPIIAGLLQFIADWSALGARPQLGFGVVHLQERAVGQPLYNRLALTASNRALSSNNLPSLENIFFARIAAPSSDWKEVLDLRYDLRQLFAGNINRKLRHSLFGTVSGQRRASKVKVSAPYGSPPAMRIWGWVPEDNRPRSSIPTIHTHLLSVDSDLTWRELDSKRDTEAVYTEPLEFLADLLEVNP
jgi:CRISPR-associated protein Cmr1